MSIPYNDLAFPDNFKPNPIIEYSNPADLPIMPDFSFLSNSSCDMMCAGYNAIQQKEGWAILRNFNGESFMFSMDPKILDLKDSVAALYTGHSGCSLSITMRNLEYIAKHGFSKFKELCLR